MKRRVLLIVSCLLLGASLYAQQKATIFGFVKDTSGTAIDLANIALQGGRSGTVTSQNGFFELVVPANQEVSISISCIGFDPLVITATLNDSERREFTPVMTPNMEFLSEVSVSARQERASTFQRIDVRNLDYMPSTTGKIESVIKSQAGVSSNNELSSQYSVRGGNFDENLVYVNDVEIYRPFLVRSGQQEGLSFINSDLVSSIRFSAGGFEARYGDKMSSALDITYKRPTDFGGSASVSLLGASAHIEGVSDNERFTFLAGYRYKTTSYLLNTLQTSGDYNPQFSDFQTMLTYRLTNRMELSFLGNYSANRYQFIPSTRSTEFGTQELPFNLVVFYEGQEVDKFDTYLGAVTLNIRPNKNLQLKFITTGFRTMEQETFDIRGEYWINELDNTLGSETSGDSILNLGVGTLHNHARNYLDAIVLATSHIGTYSEGAHTLRWGLKYQFQDFYDRISEWEQVDSAGYSLPYSESEVNVISSSRATNRIDYGLMTGFIQDTWEFSGEGGDFFLTTGVRGSLWNFNRTFFLSPRATFSYQPVWERDMMFHLAGGVYYQPPFYKEMRTPDEEINQEIEPQRSIHLLAGGDYIFSAWNRPFKLTAEIYYKWLDNLIPYKIDNVRIRYAGENIASGYARGIDLKLNGEFVEGAESWFTASLMQTREDIEGDVIRVQQEDGTYETVEAGYYSRPTDQLFSTGVYFQDYFPNNPDYKVQLSAFFGTGLPLSHPSEERYYTTYKMRPYRRVDIGFSKVLKREDAQFREKNPFRHFSTIWISGEIFNMLGIKNQASYSWIRTVANQSGLPAQFGVPNYLTGRRFNVKVTARF